MAYTDSYIPAEAEAKKFAPISMAALSTIGFNDQRYALLTYEVGNVEVARGEGVANTANNYTGTYNASATVVTAPSATPFSIVEVYNNSDQNAYFSTGSVAFSALSATGMIVKTGAYYSLNRVIPSFTLGMETSAGELRVIAHNRVG